MSRTFCCLTLAAAVLLSWWFVSSQVSASQDKAEREVGCLLDEDC